MEKWLYGEAMEKRHTKENGDIGALVHMINWENMKAKNMSDLLSASK